MPFEVRNVETDLAAYQDLIARGFRTVPVTIIGDSTPPVAVTGFNESGLKKALGIV